MHVVRVSVMKAKEQKPRDSKPPATPQSRLARQMSEVISLREKVAQAELQVHLYGLPQPRKAERDL